MKNLIIVDFLNNAICFFLVSFGVYWAAIYTNNFFKAVKDRNKYEESEKSVSGSDEKQIAANPYGQK